MMFTSQSISVIIVIYLFMIFAMPVELKKEVKAEKEENDEYDEDFDEMRDPNADLMYYAKKNMANPQQNSLKLSRREANYDVSDGSGSLDDALEDTNEDENDEEIFNEDAQIDAF
jgi:hypothetical protein